MQDEPIALKRIRIEDRRPLKIVMREVETLRKRQHEHIVKILASYTETRKESEDEETFVNILFPWAEKNMDEWMKMKNAPDWLPKHDRDEQQKHLYTVLYELISALAYLHREIEGELTSHHDLKPNNILVYREKLVLADLGCCHLRSVDDTGTEGVYGLGTYPYHPPEYWTDNGTPRRGVYGRSFDVWAMGCIMVDVAILIVYGWESGKVKEFKEARKKNNPKKRRFKNQECEDHSFHNNINIVDQWLEDLRRDGSDQLKKMLVLVTTMLEVSPGKRPYSWEAKLDMYDVLRSDAPDEDRRTVCEETVPRPPKEKLHHVSTPLHRAANKGDLIRAKILVQRGWLPGIKDAARLTPAQLAQRSGYPELANFLSQSETVSNPTRAWRLQDWILNNDSLGEALCSYVREDDYSQVQGLLDRHHVNVNYVHETIGTKDVTMNYLRSDPFFPDRYSASALHLTHSNKTTNIAELLLEKGADVNQKNSFGVTPLHMAAFRGNIDFVKLFLDHDANINSSDKFGQTPLFCAAFAGKKNSMKLLLSNKADVNAMDKDGMSLLHNAVRNAKANIVRKLLEMNIDIDAENREGHTALHLAVLRDDETIISLLLANKASPNLKNKMGISPLHDAVNRDKIECVRLLLHGGANLHIRNHKKETVLFAEMSKPVYDELVDNGADINAKNIDGKTMPRRFE